MIIKVIFLLNHNLLTHIAGGYKLVEIPAFIFIPYWVGGFIFWIGGGTPKDVVSQWMIGFLVPVLIAMVGFLFVVDFLQQ